jgi:hypothetical protein
MAKGRFESMQQHLSSNRKGAAAAALLLRACGLHNTSGGAARSCHCPGEVRCLQLPSKLASKLPLEGKPRRRSRGAAAAAGGARMRRGDTRALGAAVRRPSARLLAGATLRVRRVACLPLAMSLDLADEGGKGRCARAASAATVRPWAQRLTARRDGCMGGCRPTTMLLLHAAC